MGSTGTCGRNNSAMTVEIPSGVEIGLPGLLERAVAEDRAVLTRIGVRKLVGARSGKHAPLKQHVSRIIEFHATTIDHAIWRLGGVHEELAPEPLGGVIGVI